jgi:hypothetical protein
MMLRNDAAAEVVVIGDIYFSAVGKKTVGL